MNAEYSVAPTSEPTVPMNGSKETSHTGETDDLGEKGAYSTSPLGTAQFVGNASSQLSAGKVRLVFGKGKPKGSEHQKRVQPPSPMKDRMPKRHTSEADPPIGSPERPNEQSEGHKGQTFTLQRAQTYETVNELDGSSPPSTPTNTHYRLDDHASSEGGANVTRSARATQAARDSMEIDEEFRNQSATAVADSEWDALLNDPPQTTRVTSTPFRFTIPEASPLARRLTPTASINKGAQGNPTADPISPPAPTARNNKRSQGDEFHRDIKSEDNIVTNSVGLQRTATPNGGWPRIHLDSNPLDNVSPTQVAAWKKVTSGKLWARTFRGKYEHNSLNTVDKTRAIIKGLVQVENDVLLGVSFPQQERRIDSDRFPTPYHMLVSGLTTTQVDHLTNLEIVSTKDITVIFKPFKDQRPTFVLTIYGLTFSNSADAQTAVTDLVKSCIRDSEAVMKHIAECAPKLKDRVTNDILNNISTKFLDVKRSNANGGDFRGWNVYLHHSYLSDEDHVKLIQLVRLCTFPSATAGFGIPLRGKDTLLCVNCKSIDHDMPNCPFTELPGWLGYKPPTTQQTQAASRAYGDGPLASSEEYTTFRGRGRGSVRFR